MKKSLAFASAFIFLYSVSFCQATIDVAENTIKVAASGEQEFFYGFAKGDKLIFSIEEVNGKDLKEVEILQMPSSSLFMDYKTKKIERKVLDIRETGVYKFRFTNSNILSARICKFKIQRIPATLASEKFNPTVYKRKVYDTSYYEVPESYLVKADTVVTQILNQTAKVHSTMNANGNKTIANFILPKNTIAWSYYIGVDQAGQQSYEDATKNFVNNATPFVKSLVGSSPVSALALGFTSYLSQIQAGEDIDYFLVEGQNANLFAAGQRFRFFKRGKVINDFAKMPPIEGNLSFCFMNDNALTGVSVLVKIVAVQVNGTWATRQVRNMNLSEREELYLRN